MRESILWNEKDEVYAEHTRQKLLVMVEKLLQYRKDDTSSAGFKLNFRECQLLLKELEGLE